MHLDECFQLAFSQPPSTINKLQENEINSANSNSYLSFLRDDDNSSTIQHQLDKDKIQYRRRSSGSIYSMLQCMISEWGTKSQTNFYIPSQHYYSGYTYLFDDNEDNSNRLDAHYAQNYQIGSIQHQNHRNHVQKSPKFVYADDSPNNLHSHHYEVYMRGNLTQQHSMYSSSINMTTLASDNNFMYSITSHHTGSNNNLSPPITMTIPYIHPQLEMPVPPLNLPTYFGILCWTYALAGMVILSLPPKWCLYGGGYVTDSREEEKKKKYRRHWFPVRLYGWALILCQSPCSFLADYVHMTNISAWHTIDRFLACTMMCLELAKLVTMSVYTRPYIYMLNLTSVGLAMFCFLQSQKSQQALDEDGFIFWHCGWHCYPIAACIIHISDHYLNRKWGEYYPFDECDVNGTREEEAKKQKACTDRPSLRRSRRLAGKAPPSHCIQ